MSSRNAVTKAAKTLMKQKTGEDRAVLKKKLQDLEREWEKVCQMSVDRQSKLEEAYRGIGEFRSVFHNHLTFYIHTEGYLVMEYYYVLAFDKLACVYIYIC